MQRDKAAEALSMMQGNLKARMQAKIRCLEADIERLDTEAKINTGSFLSVAQIASNHGDTIMAEDAAHLAAKYGEPYIVTPPLHHYTEKGR
jgi:hypothetical protein